MATGRSLLKPLGKVETHEGRAGGEAASLRHLDATLGGAKGRRRRTSPRSVVIAAEMIKDAVLHTTASQASYLPARAVARAT